jgi:multiple sugar transport system substrate-binding protein
MDSTLKEKFTSSHILKSAPLLILIGILLIAFILALAGCQRADPDKKSITLAVNSGVEGDALKQAASDYEAQTGVQINIAEFPYANLFEKELIDLSARSGAYDLIMLDDPWFPKFASQQLLTELTPLLERRGLAGPDDDFVATSIALGREPYQIGALYALPYVGNSQLLFYRKDLFTKHNLKSCDRSQHSKERPLFSRLPLIESTSSY